MRFFIKFIKIIGLFLFVFLILPIAGVVSYSYLEVALAPVYNAKTMSLNYEIVGSGEKKLILLHGLAGSKNYWKRDLENISRTHQLLLIDLLGFGDSPKPQSNYSLNVQLEAIEKIVLKEGFNKNNTVIVGHSLGAILSLELLAKYPDWFIGAAVIGLPVFTSKNQFIENMSSQSLFDRLSVGPYAKFVCMLQPIYLVSWLKPDNLPADVFEDSKKHTWQSYYNSLYEVILKTNLYTIADSIRNKKLLFIQGEADKVAPFANVKKFAETILTATFIDVKNGDHQLFLENPSLVWNLINQYF
ncbi:MAG: alpha/beta hydrolase [Saprospiraceae bacterium]